MEPVEFEILNCLSSHLYSRMTFPSFRVALESVSSDGRYSAIGASCLGQPAGLVIAESKGRQTGILSLYVDRAHRGRGLATSLLQRIEEHVTRLGSNSLRIGYLEKSEQSAALERVLQKCGWPAPVPHKVYATFRPSRMLEAPFMKDYELPAGFEMVLWRDLTESQRDMLREECDRADWIPYRLIPFRYEVNMETRNSLALLINGRVVGWQLTQQLQPEVLTYSCSYVHPQMQTHGLIFKMYVETVRLQSRLIPEFPSACLVVPMDFTSMVAFVRRRFAPFLDRLTCFRESIKLCEGPVSLSGRDASADSRFETQPT